VHRARSPALHELLRQAHQQSEDRAPFRPVSWAPQGGSSEWGRSLNPCGLIMDMMRSCYATTMVFRDGDEPVPVLWYFADEGALCHPSFNFGGSHNWQSRVSEAGAIGEQPGPRFWSNGAKPANGGSGDAIAKACALEQVEEWANGLGPGQETGPYDSEGVPICCKGPCCECLIPDTITATMFNNLCPCIHDQVVVLHRQKPECRWRGQMAGSCGGKPVELEWEVSTEEPECAAVSRFICDGVVVGEEADSWFCEDNAATTVINPVFNDCCSETITIDFAWVPE